MNSLTPKISVGMPVYNSEKYVEAAIHAVLVQTYPEFELIISDNASTDRTPEICQEYAAKDSRIRYFRNSHNLGATPNINSVVARAAAPYFKWAFYDDLIAPEFLAQCIKVLDGNPDVVLCVPQSNVIDENGLFLGIHEYRSKPTSPHAHRRFRNYVLNYDAGWELFGVMRMSALQKTALHGWYPGSDHVFLAEMTLHGQFHVIPEPLLFPRIHPEQIWITTPKERDRVLFEDTSLEGKIVLPKWGWVGGYLRAIRHAPLSRYQRLHCYVTLACWMKRPQHLRALGKDIVLAAQTLLQQAAKEKRPFSKASKATL